MQTYNDFMKSKTYGSQIHAIHGDNPIHAEHVVEFQQMAAAMIDQALREHDEQLQLDVQTTLNGRSVSLPGLVSDMKKQITAALRKAFK